MRHTKANRAVDGRFSPSDEPKAKRIEVWLQPHVLSLLDGFAKEWSVGRGKVIERLILGK